MTASWGQVEYSGVHEIRGPLIVVRGVAGVGWDESAEVRLDSGEVRAGLVLEVDRDLAVVQVMEGTDGLDPGRTRVGFTGDVVRIPVGDGWLGRSCDGRGSPRDGGPPILGRTSARVTGRPINPTLREPPRDPVLTG
ncbi:MAG: hypothetical protein WCS84_16745, partial [Nocardioides sp.]